MSASPDFDAIAAAMGTALGGSDEGTEPKLWLDLGYAPLNRILSNSPTRGFAGGRIVEIAGPAASGKTLLATLAMKACQDAGGFAVFIDWERAFNAAFAAQIGLDVSPGRFLYKRSETWESGNTDAMRAAELLRTKKLIAPEAPVVIVLDSVASAVPKSVMYDKDGKRRGIDEQTMNDTTALARVTSTTLKSINQLVGEFDVTAIYLNQIRTKPGVCLRYDSPVTLADGTQVKIGKLVHDRKPVEVLTVDPETRQVTVRKIEQFHRNAHDGKWVQIQTAGGRNGRRSAFFTPEHQVLTPGGWVRADAIKLGDKVNTVDLRHYTERQHEIILGALLGDGQIRFGDGKSPISEKGRLRMVHGHKQRDYLAWKCKLLGLPEPKDAKLHSYADTASSHEFGVYRTVSKFKALLEVPDDWIEEITDLTAAIWFMDDGTYTENHGGKKYGEGRYSIAAKKLSHSTLEKIAARLNTIGLGRAICKEGKGLFWSGEEAAIFGAGIAQYIPSSMAYKLNRKLTATGDLFTLPSMLPEQQVYANAVIKVSHTQGGTGALDRYKYDIGIPDTHTFIAGGGMVVHNCYGDPRTTPGGGAMEFYASQRLFTGRKKLMATEGGEKVFKGALIGMETVKNKLAKPFQSVDLNLAYDDDGRAHFDFTTGYIEALCDLGALEEKAGRVTWEGKTYYKSQLSKKLESEGATGELAKLYVASLAK